MIKAEGQVTVSFTVPGSRQPGECRWLAISIIGILEDMPMYKGSDGVWYLSVPLAQGRHEYRFVADGVWQDNPAADNKGLPTPWVVRIV